MKQHGVKRYHLSEQAREQKRAKEEQLIRNYNTLTQQLLQNKSNKVYTESMFHKTTEILNVNPEFYTMWNYRRDIITKHYVKTLSETALIKFFDDELMYNMAKFQRFPKVYWIFNHRVWVLENHPAVKWENELLLVAKIHKADPRNFHGWTYRRYIIGQMSKTQDLTIQEFDYTTRMINANFSNFSALHNRTKLIPVMFEKNLIADTPVEFFKKELDYLHNAMFTDPEDQGVFLYLRWILTSDVFVKGISTVEYLEILKQELSLIHELNELEKGDGSENGWCLKSIVMIRGLIDGVIGHESNAQETKETLQRLIQLDPLRKNRYIDML